MENNISSYNRFDNRKPNDDWSYDDKLKSIKEHGYTLKYLNRQSTELINEALKHSQLYSKHIKLNSSVNVDELNLDVDGFANALGLYKRRRIQPHDISLKLVETSRFALNNIRPENRTAKMIEKSIRKYPSSIRCVLEEEQGPDIQLLVISKNPHYYKYLKNPCEIVSVRAIERYPNNILLIDNPTEEMWIAALAENPDLIKKVECQSDELSIIAVKQDGLLLKYVKKQTKEIVRLAIENNPIAKCYIRALDLNLELLDEL